MLPALLVVALVVALFLPAVASGHLLAPADGMAIYFPFRAIGFESIRHLAWPFWNPFDFSGTPLFAALQGGFLYPGNWTFLVLPPVMAMNASVMLAYATAGLGMLLLTRACGLGRLAGMAAALGFMTSGFLIAHLEHLGMIQAASLLPWLLWAIERLRRTGDQRYALAGCLILALQILAGHPQMVVLSQLITVPYALWRSLSLDGAARLRFGLTLGLMALLAFGLSAVQLGPTLSFIAETNRQGFSYDQLVAESLPPRQVLSLWFPFLFGAPPSAWLPTPPWGAGPWFDEFVGYAGLPGLVLAGVGVSRWRQEPAVRFWAAVGAIALLLALGSSTPLYELWAHLPVLNTMRAPARHLLEVDMAIAMLAAYGVQGLVERAVSRRAALGAWALLGLPVLGVAAGIGLLGPTLAAKGQPFMPAGVDLASALSLRQPAIWLPIALWLATGVLVGGPPPVRGRAWRAALALLVAADLGSFAWHQGWRQLSPSVPASLGQDLLAHASPERSLVVSATPYPYFDFDDVRRLHAGGYAALLGERSVGGYDAFIKRRYAELLGGMTHGGTLMADDVWAPGHHGLDLLNTRLVRVETSLLQEPAWASRLASPRWRRLGKAGGVTAFENRRALPPAWRVARLSATTPAQITRRMTDDPTFEPAREALVEAPLAPRNWTAGTATVERPSFNRLRVATDGPGLLVVSESFDPGWRAFEGDRELPVYRVDGLLMGAEVDGGAHVLDFRYEPRSWRLGAIVSAAALLLLVGLLAGLGLKKRVALK